MAESFIIAPELLDDSNNLGRVCSQMKIEEIGYRDGNTVIKDIFEGLANSAVVGRLLLVTYKGRRLGGV